VLAVKGSDKFQILSRTLLKQDNGQDFALTVALVSQIRPVPETLYQNDRSIKG